MGELWVSREDRGFADGLDVQCGRKEPRITDNFHLNRCKSRITVHLEKAMSHPEKAMATPSSTLAWKIPWIEEPGRLHPMGSLRVRHD